jgi:hypothetical protein
MEERGSAADLTHYHGGQKSREQIHVVSVDAFPNDLSIGTRTLHREDLSPPVADLP